MAGRAKLKRVLIMMLMCFMLCSCFSTGSKDIVEDSGEEETRYRKTVKELNVNTSELNYNLLAISETSCYYVTEIHEEEEAWEIRKIDYGMNEEKLLTRLVESIFFISLGKEDSGQEKLYVLSCNDENVFLHEVNDRGEEVRKIVLSLNADDRYGLKGACSREDGKYWIYWQDAYCLMDEEGICQEKIVIKNATVQNLIRSSNDTTYAVLFNEDAQTSVLRDLENTSNKEIPLPGDGEYIYSPRNRGILAFADGMLYEIDLETQKRKEVLNLKNYVGVSSDTIRGFWADEEEYRFLCVSMLSGNFRLSLQCFTELSEEEKEALRKEEKKEGEYDQYGRQIVRVYDPTGLAVSDFEVNEYNTISEKYCIVVERERKEEALVLTVQNAPDMMAVFDYRDIERYCQKGYLVDLLPYLESSKKLTPEDLMEWEFTCYGWENGLYGLSTDFCVMTMIGKKSLLGEKKGWTSDEYLTFLENHPHVVSKGPMEQLQVLQYGIQGNLEAYIDFSNGKADFTQQSFREFLSRIKDLKLEAEVLENSDDAIGEDMDFLTMTGYQNVDAIAMIRTRMGGDFVIKGFPNDQGKEVSFLDPLGGLSIIRNGNCKEGAVDFLEYKMRRDLDYRDIRSEEYTSGLLYGLKELYQMDQEHSLGPREHKVFTETGREYVERYEVTQKDVDLLNREVENAVTDTLEARTILIIILEEAVQYFNGDISLDAACDAIQGRAQLLLDENR